VRSSLLNVFIAPDASSLKIDLFLGIIACGRKKIIAHRIFHGVWLGNHPFYDFYLCQLKSEGFVRSSLVTVFINPNASSPKIGLYLGIVC
jgi:hypothetical protein